MTDELKHECAVAMVVLRKSAVATGDFGGTKLSLLLEKQHNRGQDGAGAAILSANPEPGETPYWIAKSASATPLADVLAAIGKRVSRKERIERKEAEHSAANNQERIPSIRARIERTNAHASSRRKLQPHERPRAFRRLPPPRFIPDEQVGRLPHLRDDCTGAEKY